MQPEYKDTDTFFIALAMNVIAEFQLRVFPYQMNNIGIASLFIHCTPITGDRKMVGMKQKEVLHSHPI